MNASFNQNILNYITVCFVIFTFTILLIKDWRYKRSTRLEELLLRAFSAAGIPIGLFFILGAFNPDLLIEIAGIEVYLAAAGLMFFYIFFRNIFSPGVPDSN